MTTGIAARRRGIKILSGGTDERDGVRGAWWRSTFEERIALTSRAFGASGLEDETVPLALADPDGDVADACILNLAPCQGRAEWLHIGLGLSQPHAPRAPASSWEICIRTRDEGEWSGLLLHDLLLHHVQAAEHPREGEGFPIGFYDSGFDPRLCLLFDNPPQRSFRRTSAMRGLVLWRDLAHRSAFETRTGRFRLLTGTTVTQGELELGETASPAHLMLWLVRMGVGQVSDPDRGCLLDEPGAMDEWEEISGSTEVQAMRDLSVS